MKQTPLVACDRSRDCYVTTFYSFKGGVGRTMLLANVGALLARSGRGKGRRVLLWDLDLEAPGLHRIPGLKPEKPVDWGFLNWLAEHKSFAGLERPSAEQIAELTKCIVSAPASTADNLDILPAFGRGSFASVYAGIQWEALLIQEPERGANLFACVLAALSHLPYDHILIDSRTGLTDLGGLLTARFPDQVVMVTGLGEQSLGGTAEIFEALQTAVDGNLPGRNAALSRLVVASPIPQNDRRSREERMGVFREKFRVLPNEIVVDVPHRPELLFKEKLLAIEGDAPELAAAYTKVAETVETERSKLQKSAANADIEAEINLGREYDAESDRSAKSRAERLESLVFQLLEWLGHSVERHPRRGDAQFDAIATATHGLADEEVVVEVESNPIVDAPAVERLASSLSRASDELGPAKPILVGRAFSPTARQAAGESGIKLLTVDELEARIIDPTQYLRRLCRRYEESALARRYVNQRALHEPGGPDGSKSLVDAALEWRDSGRHPLWLVLGDYGTGKSVFARTAAYRMASEWLSDKSKPFPLSIDLKEYPNAIEIESLLQDHLRKEIGWQGAPEALVHLLRRGKLVLLLDAFDEMATANDARSVDEQFRKLVKPLAARVPGEDRARILLTCRTHFFRDQQQVKDAADAARQELETADSQLGELARSFGATLSEMELFNEEQIHKFLELNLPGPAEVERTETFIAKTFDLKSLAPRPVLLEMIVASAPSLAVAGGEVTPAKLYEHYLGTWLRDRSGGHLKTTPEQRWKLLQRLAFELWGREQHRIHYSKLPELLEALPEALRRGVDHVRIDLELRTAAFLTRTSDGYYSFSHKSFREFFLARHIADGLASNWAAFADALNTAPITPEAFEFLYDTLASTRPREAIDSATHLILTSDYRRGLSENALRLAYHFARRAAKGDIEKVAAAMRPFVPLKAKLEGAQLAGETFDGAWLQGALLTGADARNTSWARAKMRSIRAVGCRFDGGRFDETDLTEAFLEGASFEQAHGTRTQFANARLASARLAVSRWIEGQFGGTVLSASDLHGGRFVRSKFTGCAANDVSAEGAAFIGCKSPPKPQSQVRPNTPRFQAGHIGDVKTCAFSPDGALLASAGLDGSVRLWDLRSGALLRELKGHQGWVQTCAFSPDGALLASGCGDEGRVRLWEPRSGALLRELEGHQGSVRACAFSPDGTLLVSAGGDDGRVRLWEPRSGALLREIEGHQGLVHACAFSPDGALLASAGGDGRVRVWDPRSGALLRELEGHQGLVQACGFSPDGALLASAGGDRVRLWDPRSGALLRELEEHQGWVQACAFSPDGALLASASDGRVCLWDPRSGALLRELEGHQGWVLACAFSPDGALLASAGGDDDGRVHLWDPRSGALLRELEGHMGWVRACAFSPDGVLLASAGGDGRVRLWDPGSGALLRELMGHLGWVRACAFSPDGMLLASAGGEDGRLRLWDPRSGALLRELEEHQGSARVCAFSPDGALLASAGGDDGRLRLWDPRSGALRRELEGHQGSVQACAFSPDGGLLASAGGDDGRVRLWDPRSGALLREFEGHQRWVLACAFSPDGALLASAGGEGGRVRLWDPRSGALLSELEGDRRWLLACAFSPDGSLLVSVGGAGSVRLWDPRSGALLREFQGHLGPVRACAFSPDGRTIASGSGSLQLARASAGHRLWESWSLNDGWASIDAEGRVRGDDRGLEHVVYTDPDERALIPTLWHANDVSEEFRMTPKPRYRELHR